MLPRSPVKLTLVPKLVTSYVVLGVGITVLSLLGGQTIHREASESAHARTEWVRHAADAAALASASSEEGFSFLLGGVPAEKAAALSKLDAVAVEARGLRGQARTPEEIAEAQRVLEAMSRLHDAALPMLDGRGKSDAAQRYQAYDTALDALGDELASLRRVADADFVRESESALRRSEGLTVLLGLVALSLAALYGGAIARRITKPVLALRDVVSAFGAGELAVRAPPTGHDEVGELAQAFEAMMATTRRHIQTIEHDQQHLQDIFASIAEVLLVCDESGTILDTNPACHAATGWTKQEVIGKSLSLLLPELGPIRGSMRGREERLKTAARKDMSVNLSISPLRGLGAARWVCVAQDLTQRHRLEAELRQGQKLEAIGRLASGVAHDFNNIMTIVLGYTATMLEDVDPGSALHFPLSEVRTASDRAVDLTRQLLAFSRQEQLATELVDVNDAATETARMLERLLDENVPIDCVTADDPVLTRVEPGQIQQLLMNLGLNARDAMPAGGTIVVRTGARHVSAAETADLNGIAPGDYVTLSVRDSGTGMDAATQERIFEPFFTTKAQGKGTGLGLATVFGIVQRSRGTVRVESAPGQGSTFTVLLPQFAHAVTVPVAPESSAGWSKSRGRPSVQAPR